MVLINYITTIVLLSNMAGRELMHTNIISTNQKNKKTLAFLLVSLILLSGVSQINPAYAVGYIFDSAIDVSNSAGNAATPKIVVFGSDVYVIWQDDATGNQEILFINSTDSGTTFPNPSENLSNSPANSVSPQFVASSTGDVYVVWQESDIFFTNSSDNGVSFGTSINLSNSGVTPSSQSPQIVPSSSGDVYVVWKEGSDIFFTNSSDNGVSFGSSINLSNSGPSSSLPQIAASSSGDVYVVWRESSDIFFTNSSDNGVSFGTSINISNLGATSSFPQIAASSSGDVYVVWKEGNDIFFTKSSDNGVSFSMPMDVGDTGLLAGQSPQIAVVGSSVYLVWAENISGAGEISFRKSTNNGVSFDAKVNLSSNSGISSTPSISALSSNVTVAWQDDTPGNFDIFFKGSDDNGATFGSAINLSNDTATSLFPQIALTTNRAYVVWDDDIFFRTGTPSSLDIIFNQSQYTLLETATISVTEPSSNTNSGVAETIDVLVTSTTDSTGIILTLTETGVDTGTFNGDMTFDTVASSGTTL